ncbi:acyl-CoA-binding domain-containing protein 5 isoform X1 [Phoenix dactylifera]|uniref:Acyl-CoA-binding domain-containing protein 5 isoform X1 n=1 Tax=Phoenix dactylifera TaxID=42345 RepID=A0A8B7BZ95_PHODC|nr:acyl-CoA-binding domain-containing protein 5 isoform X1 [Phoenix dactylifera]
MQPESSLSLSFFLFPLFHSSSFLSSFLGVQAQEEEEMEMGFLLELFLTAALSVLFAFLLGKIFAVDSSADDPEEKRERSPETVGGIRRGAVDGDEDRRPAEEILESDHIAAESAVGADKASKEIDDVGDGGIVVWLEDDGLVDHSLEGGFEVVQELGLDEDSAKRMPEGVGFEKAKEEGRSEEMRANEIDLESVNLEMKKQEARICGGNIEGLADESSRDTTDEVKMVSLERLHKKEERLIKDADVRELEPTMEKGEENKPEVNVLNLEDESIRKVAEVEIGEVERLLKEEGRPEEVMASEIETPENKNEREQISEIDVGRLESTREMPEKVAPERIKEEKRLLIKEDRSEDSRASDFDMENKTEGERRRQVSLLNLEDDSMREMHEVVVEETREEQKLLKEEERSAEVTSNNFEQDKEIEQEQRYEADAVKVEEDSIQAMPVEVGIDRVDFPNLVEREERSAEGEVCAENVVQSPEEERIVQEGSQSEAKGQKICIHEEGSLLNEEDDWEGIEKSELEKRFGAAIAYVGSGSGGDALSKLSSDLQMQLYGLRKVATEGPCYESQPLALKVSARAKWHAWQRLGSMNPEMAMEQYMTVLSENIPRWIEGKPGQEGNTNPETMKSGIGKPDSCSTSHDQHSSETKRNLEGPSSSEEEHATAGLEHQKKES